MESIRKVTFTQVTAYISWEVYVPRLFLPMILPLKVHNYRYLHYQESVQYPISDSSMLRKDKTYSKHSDIYTYIYICI
jgi:hypothetical protein